MRKLIEMAAGVDGTWYGPDGCDGRGSGNQSNVFRTIVSVKEGRCGLQDGREVEQTTRYFHGIGVGKKALDKFNDGLTGDGCEDQIAAVLKECSDCLKNPTDELWMFGFSRGAYVVRAVAGFLHYLEGVPYSSKGEFSRRYKEALSFLPSLRKPGKMIGNEGKLYQFFSSKSQDRPTIQFLGLFDTVQATWRQSGHDLSFVESIRHVRHAVALNENRKTFPPVLYASPDELAVTGNRSIIEAWFVGAHADIGGGAHDDGLSLYALQWMLLESSKLGLLLEHEPRKFKGRNLIEDPLKLTMLADKPLL